MTQFFRILFFAIVIISCTSQTSYSDGEDIPKAFQENNNSISLKEDFGRGGNNILEELWAEYLKDNEQVANELEELDNLKTDIRKHSESFDKFISKNEAYYRSANSVKVGITDSLLRQKIALSLQKSENDFSKKIGSYKAKKTDISELYSKINDIVATLKIQETLKMTEGYQKNTKFLLEELDKDIIELEKISNYFEESL